MAIWTFRDYLDAQGYNVIRGWLDALPKRARAKIDGRIAILQGSESWPPQYISALKGYPGILELRVVDGGVQYRPLGTYGPLKREFTLLLGTIEKGKLAVRDCATAVQRRATVLADRSRTIEHEF
jgi:Phage derived protein Gp49-like (DUF891)